MRRQFGASATFTACVGHRAHDPGATARCRSTRPRSTRRSPTVDELQKFLATDGATTATKGFMPTACGAGRPAAGADGSFECRNAAWRLRIDRNGDRQEQLETGWPPPRSACARSTRRWTRNMASSRRCQNYVSQQLHALNKA
jgi:hypothetical protein